MIYEIDLTLWSSPLGLLLDQIPDKESLGIEPETSPHRKQPC